MPSISRALPSPQGESQRHPHVFALLADRTDAATIIGALRPLQVDVVSTLEQLRDLIDSSAVACAGILVEARDAMGHPTAALIHSLTRSGRRIPVLGYCDAGARGADAMRELAHAGVHELVFRGIHDSPSILAQRIRRSEEACAAGEIIRRIKASVPTSLLPVAEYVVNYPRECHSVSAVALTLGVNRKTLVNWCSRAGAPPPGVLITWCRLLLAAELLQAPGQVVERVANSLEFASASAFRNQCQRYLARRPSTFAEPCALPDAYRAFSGLFDNPK